MIVYYIENEIDKKYQDVFLPAILPNILNDLQNNELFLFYRKVPGLVPADKIVEFMKNPSKKLLVKTGELAKITSIPRLLKFMNTRETKSTLITCYNFQKRDINKYLNIDVINLGHSISGNTRYNLRVWVEESKPGSVALVPGFFNKVKGGNYSSRNKIRNRIDLNTYYKLMYTLGKPLTEVTEPDSTVLFLPHWTTPIQRVYEIAKSVNDILPVNTKMKIKLHPASIYETTIFLNRTVKEDATSVDDERKKSAQLAVYNEFIDKINSLSQVEIFNDDKLELVDAIDQSKYLIFDGHSNTLPESIFRAMYHGQIKKIAVIDPHIENPAYVLPDLFGYKFIDSIKSMDDFVAFDEQLMLSYINVKSPDFMKMIVDEYSSIITRLVKGTNEEARA